MAAVEVGQAHMRRAVLAIAVALPLVAGAEETRISWEEAGKHVGETVVVTGRVMGVHCSPLSCLLAFEPTFDKFTAMVPASAFRRLPPDQLDERFSGRLVQVRGQIVMRDKKPEIVVEKPDDLVLTRGEQRRQREQEKADSDAETAERLADVLERLVALTERLAAVQQRMEAVLTQLDQRVATLQAPEVEAPAPPPSYGEPQQRPAYEALRHVKRGMSFNDVARLIGQPGSVEYGANGWTVWDYGFGRSVTFDGRGRAQSLVGFPQP